MWRCKECSESFSNRYELLKHIRLQHSRRQRYLCPHLNCPCSFKTFNALRIHLSRIHPEQSSQKAQELNTFKCPSCNQSNLSTERDFFTHIGIHFKSHETVTCVFADCNFETNIYGTFHSHKNRKHNPHTITDFKAGIVTSIRAQDDADDADDDNADDILDLGAVASTSAASTNDVHVSTTLPDIVEQNFAAILLKLEHFTHVPGAKIDNFLEELHYLLSSATFPLSVNIIEAVLQKNGCVPDRSVIEEIAQTLSASNPLVKAIEKGGSLSTSYRRNNFYRDSFDVVEPVEYMLDESLKRSFQYVPILKSLQALFNRKDVVDKVVENYRIHLDHRSPRHTYKSFQDGSIFKENAFLTGDELRILITLYIDDFEVCNPLGTSRRKHKLCGIYWTLGNMPPGSQSVLSSIYLTVLCKSDDVKKYGYEIVLRPLLQDVKALEQDGIFVPLLGKSIKGTIHVVVADNLGAHSIAGFNESFTAGHICRFCTATRAEIQTCSVRSGSLILRTKELHDLHVNTAQESSLSCFGVKKQCVITENLSHFSVQTGYPPDIMHDVLEGIVPVELAQCLSLLISKKYFNLEVLNKSILSFPYKWSDKTNKPSAIPRTFTKTIGGNAHENWALIRLLPFMIGHLVPKDEEAWQLLLVLKDVVELLVAPTHTEESVAYLESKISEHRKMYQELFPSMMLLPKHHYVEHYPALIKMFGPLIGVWTMRFEAKHSFFKHVIRHTNCFKNVPLSLAVKHQLMISYHMRASSFPRPDLEMTNASAVHVDVLSNEIAENLKEKLPGVSEVHMTSSVTTKGVCFKKGMIVVHGSTSGLPDFGQIVHMLVIQERLFFIVKRLCGWYSEHYRAFELTACPTKDLDLVEHCDLADDYPLADYMVGSTRMVALKRHVLLEGMAISRQSLLLRGRGTFPCKCTRQSRGIPSSGDT